MYLVSKRQARHILYSGSNPILSVVENWFFDCHICCFYPLLDSIAQIIDNSQEICYGLISSKFYQTGGGGVAAAGGVAGGVAGAASGDGAGVSGAGGVAASAPKSTGV